MTGNVVTGHFSGAPFRELAEVETYVWNAIMQFEGRVPAMGVIGVLRLIEHRLINDAIDSQE